MDNKEFGIYLTQLREKSGFKSQRKLAIKSGISSATLSRIESGIQRPLPETLKILAVYLKDVEYEELLNAAGYLENIENQLPDKKIDNFKEFDPLSIIRDFLEKKGGAEQFGFFNIDEWKDLTPEQVEDFLEDIDYMFQKAKKRNQERD
jgi:transcriptional regulator with XRE-family HTH domain